MKLYGKFKCYSRFDSGCYEVSMNIPTKIVYDYPDVALALVQEAAYFGKDSAEEELEYVLKELDNEDFDCDIISYCSIKGQTGNNIDLNEGIDIMDEEWNGGVGFTKAAAQKAYDESEKVCSNW